ncbi:MAG TPA: amylo-alpha-1,6-glucosidase [Gemmatimonadales bacterium]|jgi:glycogen debranching enzyme|nr:amylo-alpha-1,6-glucosidase [Gemmatimonadales bacterium]
MTAARAGEEAVPATMQSVVGYGAIDCTEEDTAEDKLVLTHDRLFCLVTSHGNIAPPGRCSLGLFHDDTRILSDYQLRMAGGPPALLSAEAPRAYTAQVDLAVSDLPFGGDAWDPKHAVHVRRELVLSDRLTERVTLTNYLAKPLDFWVELSLGCDFADIFEARGWRRAARGQFFAPLAEGDRLLFRYRGRDGRMIASLVRFCSPPGRLTPEAARWEFSLASHVPVALEWEVLADDPSGRSPAPIDGGLETRRAALEREYREWRRGCSRWTTNVAKFDVVLRRAVDDLRALYMEVDGDRVISAGIPWYSTIFGRDSIITSLQTLSLNPRIARDTLRYLARRQGTREDPFTEEQPGRILHELRRGEMARAGEIPHVPYYGTVDATPLWLVLLHETWRWTGDEALVRELLPNAERALDWIDRYGDADGDGFVEYTRTSAKGLVNQGWKDSGDGVPYPDGRKPTPPVALVEVQGYVYDAKVRMAELFARFGRTERAAALARQAEDLRAAIRERFWMPDTGTFALALDGAKRQVPTITSNAGHLLWSRVPTPEEAESVGRVLLGPDLFSGWGIRTLAASHRAFNPMSYHNGSVWPHDNAIAVLGLALYGRARDALPIVRGMHEAAVRAGFQRLPELFCGMPRQRGVGPVRYPVSCSPQAWASGALFLLLQSVLGIYPEASRRVLHVRNPVLPDVVDELTISGMAVGDARVSLQFRRHGERTLANLFEVSGAPLQVRIELD